MRSRNPAFRNRPEFAAGGQGQHGQPHQQGYPPHGGSQFQQQGGQFGSQFQPGQQFSQPGSPFQQQGQSYPPQGQPQTFRETGYQQHVLPGQAQQPSWGSAADLNQAYQAPAAGPLHTRRMTLDDVIVRTAVLFAVVITVAFAVAGIVNATGAYQLGRPITLLTFAATVGLGLAIHRSRTVPVPLIFAYAVVEGVFVGTVSAVFEYVFPGIVITAVLGTFGAFVAVLVLYKIEAIRATPALTRWIITLTIGYFAFVVINLLMVLVFDFSMFYDTGILGIGISIFAVGLASLNLILDFNYIEQGVRNGIPEQEAWRGAFGLMVTIVWLYFEMIRLISLFRD